MNTPTLAAARNSENIRKISGLASRYCRDNLSATYLQKDSFEKDWWSGLRLFLNHSFFQGRRDEISEKVEAAAMPVLSRYFEHLDPAKIGSTDFTKLRADLRAVMGKGKIGKERDIEMLVSIFQFISALPDRNLALYSVAKIREGKLSGHYRELQGITQVGPKIASFYLRDLVCIYDLDAFVRPEDLNFLQPIDVWVRKVAHRMGITGKEDCPDDQVRSGIVDACAAYGVSAFRFNPGAWYLGRTRSTYLSNSLTRSSTVRSRNHMMKPASPIPGKPSSSRAYALPAFLEGVCDRSVYVRWLQRKAVAHVRRDRKRFGVDSCSIASYKTMIHEAVLAGGGRDYYTGLPLDWTLISRFDNEDAKAGRSEYLRSFGNLPTVDHAKDGEGKLQFVICSLARQRCEEPFVRRRVLRIVRAALSVPQRQQSKGCDVLTQSAQLRPVTKSDYLKLRERFTPPDPTIIFVLDPRQHRGCIFTIPRVRRRSRSSGR